MLKLSKGTHATLCYHNYLYIFKRYNQKEQSTNWLCKEKHSKTSITSKGEVIINIAGDLVNSDITEAELKIHLRSKHNHDPMHSTVLKIGECVQQMKSSLTISKNCISSVQNLYQNKQCELLATGISQEELINHNFPQFAKVRGALYKNRLKSVPTIH